MEEIIKIAFSTMSEKVTSLEKENLSLKKSIENCQNSISNLENKIYLLEKAVDVGYLLGEKDQLEVYKFGE